MSEITIVDDLHPEDQAMVQALFSRDPGPVAEKLAALDQEKRGRFMDRYYVGYGHKSIGDCGVTTVFVENISLYEAKVIEDSPLFAGQESSTRYIDFSKQGMIDLSKARQRKAQTWLEYYQILFDAAKDYYQRLYPNSKPKAIETLSFDLARSLLPLSMKTSVAWTTSLSHAREHIRSMAAHPCPRIQSLAEELFIKFYQAYPHSFSENDLRADRLPSDRIWSEPQPTLSELELEYDIADLECLSRRADFNSRVQVGGRLDFGSLRDLHRHRKAFIPLPFYSIVHRSKFLDDDLYAEQIIKIMGEGFHRELVDYFESLSKDDHEDLFTYPMGVRIPVEMITGIAHLRYILELRTKPSVHPTLRQFMLGIVSELEKTSHGRMYRNHLSIDTRPAAFEVFDQRANEDIVERSDGS